MLDQEGRRVFVEAYHTNENFHVCDDPQCVCHEYKTGEQEG
jgi:hypothetical protein